MAYEYDECDSNRYYFSVLHDNNIVAMLTMVDPGDGYYSIRLGKSEFADSLNKIRNTINNPVSLVITDDAMYTIDENDTAIYGPFTERATLMDPNYSSYQSIALYPSFRYSIGTGDYEWYSSVY